MLFSQLQIETAPPVPFAPQRKAAPRKFFYKSRASVRNFYPQLCDTSGKIAVANDNPASGATVGRYISSDPIGLAGGLNPFSYVGQNAVMNIDPEGLNSDGTGGLDPYQQCVAQATTCGAAGGALIGAGVGLVTTGGTLSLPAAGIGGEFGAYGGALAGIVFCSKGKGERGATGGTSGTRTDQPYKHCWTDPNDPNYIICKDHQTGKKIRKKKPADFPADRRESITEPPKAPELQLPPPSAPTVQNPQ